MTDAKWPMMPGVRLSDPAPSDSTVKSLFGDATLGQRIAGGMMAVNALLVFVQGQVVPAALNSSPFVGGAGSVVSGVFDLVIGALLLLNHGRFAAWALVRVGLGLVLFTLVHVTSGDMLSAGIQVGVSAALLLLLIGRAGVPRIVLGAVLFGLYVLVTAAGLSMLATGYNPLGGTVASLKGELDGEVAGEVQGIASPYRLQVPDTGWYLRTRASATRDNPLADRWLVRPNSDVHLLVIDEALPVTVPPEVLVEAAITNGRAASTQYTLISTEPLPAYPEQGRMIHTQYSVQGLDFESFVGIVAGPTHSYQILALAQRSGFPAVSAELRAMVESFRLPEGPAPLPPGVEQGPAGRVRGIAADYAITAPGEQWHLRTAEAAHADNPATDRWIVRPDRDAHVFVVMEQTEQAVPLDAVATSIQTILRTNNGAVEFGPVAPASHGGLGFHVIMPTANMTVEFEYRLYSAGNRTFQVVGFARKEFYPSVADELRKAVDSFEPPTP